MPRRAVARQWTRRSESPAWKGRTPPYSDGSVCSELVARRSPMGEAARSSRRTGTVRGATTKVPGSSWSARRHGGQGCRVPAPELGRTRTSRAARRRGGSGGPPARTRSTPSRCAAPRRPLPASSRSICARSRMARPSPTMSSAETHGSGSGLRFQMETSSVRSSPATARSTLSAARVLDPPHAVPRPEARERAVRHRGDRHDEEAGRIGHHPHHHHHPAEREPVEHGERR